MTHIQKKKKKI